jgi:hypothetical protein
MESKRGSSCRRVEDALLCSALLAAPITVKNTDLGIGYRRAFYNLRFYECGMVWYSIADTVESSATNYSNHYLGFRARTSLVVTGQ